MNLSDYQWSRNPRGMHDPGDNHLRWDEWGLGWVKTVFVENEGVRWAAHALEKGMTPITRVHRDHLVGRPMDDGMRQVYQAHLDAGVKWFEFYNEPNIPFEWPGEVDLRPDNMALIQPLCENWLGWAEFIINAGAYPGFITLVETSEWWGETTAWIINILNFMFDHQYDRFRNIINNGMWLAVHPYIVNHWYQEIPGAGPLSARPPEQVNHREGGWHFEYPYDPICQADDPGRTVWGGTPKQPRNDVIGLLASGVAWLEKLQERFGVGWLPVVGTEGGIWRLPDEGPLQQDNRYPPYNWASHAHGTVAMFDWIADQAPGWMFGVCLWRYHDYWRNSNPIPALGELANSQPRIKNNIPAYPAIGDAPAPYGEVAPPQEVVQEPTSEPTSEPATPAPIVTVVPPGPGPIHGTPTNHFVILGDALVTQWLFDSSWVRQYWELFQPDLMTNLDFIDFLPFDTSLAVTAIATPDVGETLRTQLLSRWSTIWVDLVAVPDAASLDSVFRVRVENGLRFA